MRGAVGGALGVAMLAFEPEHRDWMRTAAAVGLLAFAALSIWEAVSEARREP